MLNAVVIGHLPAVGEAWLFPTLVAEVVGLGRPPRVLAHERPLVWGFRS